MPEHVFVCGLSAEQRAAYPGATLLSLDKQAGNLNLKLDRLRNRLDRLEPRRLTDFIEIASYVFAADRLTSRGPLTDPGLGAQWRRHFRLIIAVREITLWTRPDVHGAIADALAFLSEDSWQFVFVVNLGPKALQDYLGFGTGEVDAAGGTSIVLFSGGLDSLAGAVEELQTTNRHVVLVSHRNLSTMGSRQKVLARRLAKDFSRRVTHVWVDNSLTIELHAIEETQRTRTFFFTAMAAMAAHIEAADRIRFYENGVMSVNLPIATQLVGARSSRSTHPHSLYLLRRLVELVSDQTIEIDNPFIWKTKAEVVRELADTTQSALIEWTNSCSRSQYAINKYQAHCGTCVQCLQRRISTLAAGAEKLDEAEAYETDFLEGPRSDGEQRVMAVETVALALKCSTIGDTDFLMRYSEQVAWVLQAFPSSERNDVAHKVIDMFRRHGKAVRSILIDAIKQHASGVLDGALPPSSLLALVLKGRLDLDPQGLPAPAPTKLPEPRPDRSYERQTSNFIAVDEQRAAILIFDRPELRGPTIFRLMKFLIQASLEDRAAGLLPDHHRSFRGKAIAKALGAPDELAISQAIRRARKDLDEAAVALDGSPTDPNLIIESTGRGYRLNPMVRVVALEEFRQL